MLSKIQRDYAAFGVEVIAIDIYRSPASEWVGYWRLNEGSDVVWGAAEDPLLLRNYNVRVLGQTAVVNSAGEIVYNGPPVGGYENLKKLVGAALQSDAGSPLREDI